MTTIFFRNFATNDHRLIRGPPPDNRNREKLEVLVSLAPTMSLYPSSSFRGWSLPSFRQMWRRLRMHHHESPITQESLAELALGRWSLLRSWSRYGRSLGRKYPRSDFRYWEDRVLVLETQPLANNLLYPSEVSLSNFPSFRILIPI